MAEAPTTPSPAEKPSGAKGAPPGDALSNTPGTEVPKTPPDPKPEFEPSFTPPITHDLRTIRREMAAAEALRPVDPTADGGSTEKMITLPESAYDRLKGLEDFRLLAVDFAQSEIPASEVLPLVRAYNELTEDPEVLDKRIKAEAAHEKVILPVPLISTDQPPSKWRAVWKFAAIGGVILILLFLVYAIGYVRGNKPIERAQAAGNVNRRAYYPTVGGWNVAINQLARGTQMKFVWITTDPMSEQYTWEVLAALSKNGRRVEVIAICPPSLKTELVNLARINRVTLRMGQIEIYRIHQAIIDNHILIDGSNSTSTWSTSDPQDIDNFMKAVTPRILPKLETVYQP